MFPDFGAQGVVDRFGQIEPEFFSLPMGMCTTAVRSIRSSGCGPFSRASDR